MVRATALGRRRLHCCCRAYLYTRDRRDALSCLAARRYYAPCLFYLLPPRVDAAWRRFERATARRRSASAPGDAES